MYVHPTEFQKSNVNSYNSIRWSKLSMTLVLQNYMYFLTFGVCNMASVNSPFQQGCSVFDVFQPVKQISKINPYIILVLIIVSIHHCVSYTQKINTHTQQTEQSLIFFSSFVEVMNSLTFFLSL